MMDNPCVRVAFSKGSVLALWQAMLENPRCFETSGWNPLHLPYAVRTAALTPAPSSEGTIVPTYLTYEPISSPLRRPSPTPRRS